MNRNPAPLLLRRLEIARAKTPSLLVFAGLMLAPCLAMTAQAKDREAPREEFLAGDAIQILIPADTGSVLKGVYPIDGTGMADLPIAGRVVIAGKNRLNIEQYLAGIWAPYLKDTHVQAIPVIRLAIMGNVREPGYYYPSPDAVIYDAIKMAGGPLLPFKMEETAHLRAGKVINDELTDQISRSLTLRESGIVSGDEILIPVPERITMKEAIPLIGTTLAIVLNALTIYFLTVQRND